MAKQNLHIVSFTIPDPPNYGGAIDVFYKIEALTKVGVNIILHCFQYDDRQPSQYLASICKTVYYYKRALDWRKAISTEPFIIATRNNKALVQNLAKDDYPILLEGMHTLSLINESVLKKRIFALRMHNIEWDYYQYLAHQERNFLKKTYYQLESKKLFFYKNNLKKVDKIFTISKKEQKTLSENFDNCKYLPVFHPNNEVKSKIGKGDFILYNGNLEVAENQKAATFIIEELYQKRNCKKPLVIAGKNAAKNLKAYQAIENIQFVSNPSHEEMQQLIENAQLHLLPTFQDTGIKLKLINAIFNGRHCIANKKMVNETGLETLCHVTETADEMLKKIEALFDVAFTKEDIEKRKQILSNQFSNQKGAEQIKEWLNALL